MLTLLVVGLYAAGAFATRTTFLNVYAMLVERGQFSSNDGEASLAMAAGIIWPVVVVLVLGTAILLAANAAVNALKLV